MSIPGQNALTAIDPRNFIINSKYQPLKIIKYGKGEISVPATNSADIDIVHGLGYAPMYLVYYEIDNNGRFWLDMTCQGGLSVLSSGNNGGDPNRSLADKYKIRFSAGNSQGNGLAFTCPFRYIILDQSIFDPPGGNDTPVGYQKSDIGMIITPTGKNALDSKIYEQIINSNCDYLKFHSTTVVSITFDSFDNGQASVDFIHGLGYVPIFTAYGYNNVSIQEHTLPVGRAPQPSAFSAFADTNKITCELTWAGTGFHTSATVYARLVIFNNNMLS